MSRQFLDRGHYFVLLETSTFTDKKTGKVTVTERKTHIIIQKCNIPPHEVGMEIKRFINDELAANPYAGVYLTKLEWEQVFSKMRSL